MVSFASWARSAGRASRKFASDDDDRRLAADAVVEVDDVLVDQPHAARRLRLADRPPFRRAVHAVTGVDIVLVDIERTRAERIVEAAGLAVAPFLQLGLALDHLRRRLPHRPFLAVLDVGAAGPTETVAPDADAIA